MLTLDSQIMAISLLISTIFLLMIYKERESY